MAYNVEITVYDGQREVGKKVEYSLKIENKSRATYKDLVLTVEKNEYYSKAAKPISGVLNGFGSLLENISVDVKEGATIMDLPETIHMFIESQSTIISRHTLKNNIEEFANNTLKKFVPPDLGVKYNIFVFGMVGATKSSLVNSFASLFSKGIEKGMARTGGGVDHNTKTLNTYNFYGRENIGCCFNIIDAWGLNNDTYKNWELSKMLEGELPFGWKMDDSRHDKKDILKDASLTKKYRRIHSCIYVCPATLVDDEQFISTTKEYFSILADAIGNPLVVLSLVDAIEPNVRSNPTANYPKLEKLRNKLANSLGIEPNRIYYGVNYFTEYKKNFHIDKNNFNILYEALKQAESFLKYSPISTSTEGFSCYDVL